MKKSLLLILSLLLNAPAVLAQKVESTRKWNLFVDLTYSSNSIVTKQTSSTLSASTASTFSAVELGGDWFMFPSFAFTGQALFPLTSSLNADIRGYDLGIRKYFSKNGFQSKVEMEGNVLESAPGWSPFGVLDFSSRTYQFSNTSVTFQGLRVGAGTDYHFKIKNFLRADLSYQMLQNTSSRTLNGFVLGFSYGMSF